MYILHVHSKQMPNKYKKGRSIEQINIIEPSIFIDRFHCAMFSNCLRWIPSYSWQK